MGQRGVIRSRPCGGAFNNTLLLHNLLQADRLGFRQRRPGMDSVAFRAWLNGIRGLNTAQRGQAMRELALAEAGISSHDDDRASGAASTPDARSSSWLEIPASA